MIKTRPHINVSNEKPPVWDKLAEYFGVKWENDGRKATVVAYGDTIYCSQEPSDDVIQHELIHLEQQGYTKKGAEVWYDKYIKEPQFRLSQELEAYKAQYQFAKEMLEKAPVVKNGKEKALNRYLNRLARDLSSPMYGYLISGVEARKLIRQDGN